MDPLSLLILGGVTVADLTLLTLIRLIKSRRDPRFRIKREVKRAKKRMGRVSDQYKDDVERLL